MLYGTVKWFDSSKGYGFITPDGNNQRDIFVHLNDLDGQILQPGQRVQYTIGENRRGPCAQTVTII